MYYFYDILLNFQGDNDLFEFYEWLNTDNIEFVKKIPLFRVSTKLLQDSLKYKVRFDENVIYQIKNKTILKSTKSIENAFVISDAKNALALELDNNGNVISRSKLLLKDEENLLETMFTMKDIDLKYEKIEKYKKKDSIRQIEEIKKLIKCEIETLYESKNISKLKYLYYEWFNKNCSNLDKIHKDMLNALQKDYNANLKQIYDFIKISYNNVN